MTGTVVRAPFGTGSKSQRQGLWLDTPDGRFSLRRKEGPSYGDRELDAFVGKRVACDGFVTGQLLLAERITPID